MESLAYIHNAVAYESNDPVPELRPLLADWEIPSSAWIATSSLVIALLITGVQQEAIAAVTGVVQTGGATLNVREAPDGQVVGTVPNGSTLQLTGRAQGGWLERADGTWVMSQYVQSAPTQTAAAPQGSSQITPSQGGSAQAAAPRGGSTQVAYARTNGAPLNVRSSPDGSIINTLPNGSQLELTGRSSNGWLERTDGTWVAARYVQANPPGSPAAAASTNGAAVATNPSPSPAQGSSARLGYVSTGGNPLNFRKSPGGEVAGRLANGTQIELTGREQNGFLERTDGTWVQAQFIQFTPPASPSPSPAASPSPSPSPVAPAVASPTASASPSPSPSPSPTTAARAASPSPSPTTAASPAPAASPSPSPTSALQATVRTNGDPLNVRSSPGGAIVGSLPNGTVIQLSGRQSGTWTQRSNGTWVATQFITSQSGSDASVAFVRTNGSPLNVRSSPNGAVVGTLPNGSRVELTGRRSGEWAQRTNSTWLSSNWISSTGGGTTPSPQPPTGGPEETAFVRTNGTPLNVRSSPGGSVVGTLPNGTQITLNGRRSGEWVQRTNGTWISGNWISTSGGGASSGGSSGGNNDRTGSDASTAFVRTNGTPLNVRSSPGGAVVGTLPSGSRVDLSGRQSGEWVQRTNGTWISGNWISSSGGTTDPGQGGDASTAFVSTNGTPLNVRSSPGGAVIGTLPNGSRVDLSGRRSGEWVQRTNGTWISGGWLSTGGTGDGNVGGPETPATVATNGNPLLVRSSPGGGVVGEYANGSRITLSGRSSGNWLQLSSGGWVSGDWVIR